MKCSDCGIDKDLDQFPRTSGEDAGPGLFCRPCQRIRSRRKSREGRNRGYHLRARYGLSESDVAARIAQQDGLCAVCRTAEATQVDHDHETGRVRGILCLHCNAGMGAFRDDPRLIYQAIDYLSTIPIEELAE